MYLLCYVHGEHIMWAQYLKYQISLTKTSTATRYLGSYLKPLLCCYYYFTLVDELELNLLDVIWLLESMDSMTWMLLSSSKNEIRILVVYTDSFTFKINPAVRIGRLVSPWGSTMYWSVSSKDVNDKKGFQFVEYVSSVLSIRLSRRLYCLQIQ